MIYIDCFLLVHKKMFTTTISLTVSMKTFSMISCPKSKSMSKASIVWCCRLLTFQLTTILDIVSKRADACIIEKKTATTSPTHLRFFNQIKPFEPQPLNCNILNNQLKMVTVAMPLLETSKRQD